ncbi:four-helix bundle copper-binding protein [Streptomyces fradiae]|uniref:four-helix bundle copper-binding protein n=1 Tax=Streptomyces fradiae TaxID=1906 RepID=UPI0035170396
METAVRGMLNIHPVGPIAPDDADALGRCIEHCMACAQACAACADACLAETELRDLAGCVVRDLDCADLCTATAAVVTRRTARNGDVTRSVLLACRTACAACAAECERHGDRHEHCRICAEACRACEQACADLLELPDPVG